MKFLAIISVTFFLLFVFVSSSSECFNLVRSNPKEEILIENAQKMFDKLVLEDSCVDTLLRNGFYKAAEVLLEELNKRKIKFRDSLVNSINSITRDMDALYSKFSFDSSEYQVYEFLTFRVSPAFMWAQSLSNVFLLIKFGHRHDAPGCLEVRNEEVNIELKDVTFKAYCVQGDVPMKLDFKLDLFDDIVPEESTWSKSSVGRLQITLKKRKSPNYWKKVYREGTQAPSNMKVWFDMKAKFQSELKAYSDNEKDEVRNLIKKV